MRRLEWRRPHTGSSETRHRRIERSAVAPVDYFPRARPVTRRLNGWLRQRSSFRPSGTGFRARSLAFPQLPASRTSDDDLHKPRPGHSPWRLDGRSGFRRHWTPGRRQCAEHRLLSRRSRPVVREVTRTGDRKPGACRGNRVAPPHEPHRAACRGSREAMAPIKWRPLGRRLRAEASQAAHDELQPSYVRLHLIRYGSVSFDR